MVTSTPTPSTATDTGPLDWRIAITDSGGRPTPEFQRRWNTQRNNNGKIGTTVGHGSPAGLPDTDGLTYINEDTNPATLYVSYGGAWHQVSAIKFLDLLDAPHNYTSAASKLVRVNGAATGLEFATFQSYLDGIGNAQGDILYRGSSGWVVLAPGTGGNVLTTHGAGADPTWTAPSTGTGTVSSVALTAPGIFSVTGSPITTSGTLALSLATQSPNLMFAGPSSGSAAAPTFRSLVAADLPLATTSAFGAVKPDGTTITISSGVISAVAGGGGSGFQTIGGPNGTGFSSTLFATKGNTFNVLENATVSKVIIQHGIPVGHVVQATVVQLDSVSVGTRTIVGILGTGTAVAANPLVGGIASLVIPLASPAALVAGLPYAVLITDTSAATTTTSLQVINAASPAVWWNFPVLTDGGTSASSIQMASKAPLVGNTLTVSTGAGFGMQLEIVALGLAPSPPSGTANQVYAAPNGSSGAATMRSLVGADLPLPTAGTLGGVESLAAVSHNFLTSITTSGVPVATQPATTDLSDVSFGTWTPVLSIGGSTTGITYAASEGIYMKIGNRCFIDVIIALSSKGTNTGQVTMNLPFAVSSAVGVNIRYNGVVVIYETAIRMDSMFISAAPGGTTAAFNFLDQTNPLVPNHQSIVPNTAINNTTDFRICMNYLI